MPGIITNRKRNATATVLALATAAALALSGTAQAAEPTPVAGKQLERIAAKKRAGADHKVRLSGKQRHSFRDQIERKSGRAYGEYLGPYVYVFDIGSYTEVQVQFTETFGLWRTWTHEYRLYGNTWYDFGWTVY